MSTPRMPPRLLYLLDWPDRDKSALLALLTLPLVLFYIGWVWVTYNFTDFGSTFFQPQGVHLMYVVEMVALLGWLLLAAVGYWLRRQDKDPSLYTLATILFYGVSLIPMGYIVGMMAPLTGVILLGAPMVGFVLFDFWRVLWSFLLNLLGICVISALTVQGVLEYAPLFVRDPVGKEVVSGYWVLSQFFFGSPFVIVAFVIIYFLLTRWRLREADTLRLSMTDALTGVANRRAIMTSVEHELARLRRDSAQVTVVLLDLDHFKSVNDTWGHDAGDRVLRTTAQILLGCLRESDWVGRYGGEEFVLLLPGTDEASAVQVVERCRTAICSADIDIGAQQPLRVSSSFGICCVRGEPLNADQVLIRADSALYAAKEAGRNCYRIWHEEAARPESGTG